MSARQQYLLVKLWNFTGQWPALISRPVLYIGGTVILYLYVIVNCCNCHTLIVIYLVKTGSWKLALNKYLKPENIYKLIKNNLYINPLNLRAFPLMRHNYLVLDRVR